MAAFLTKRFEFGRLEFEIFIEVWFWLYGVHLWETALITKRQT